MRQSKPNIGRRVQRFSGNALAKATQEAALAQWNSDPDRPAWDLNGAMVIALVNAPAGALYYLSDDGQEPLPSWVADASADQRADIEETQAFSRTFGVAANRYSSVDDQFESACTKALTQLADFLETWSRKTRILIAGQLPSSAALASDRSGRPLGAPKFRGGYSAERLRRLWESSAEQGVGLEGIYKAIADLRNRDKRRPPSIRFFIAWETTRMLRRNRRDATARELALAAILCGVRGPRAAATPAEAIGAETKAMRQMMKRYPVPGAAHAGS